MIIGIVGSEAAKFNSATESKAKLLITHLLTQPGVTGVSSGDCHLGGIDIWAEEIGRALRIERHIFPPRSNDWYNGYQPRNLQIVSASAEVHCITVKKLPASYTGMRFEYCYHCKTYDHIKSGGCWTVKQAIKQGKSGFWHVIEE